RNYCRLVLILDRLVDFVAVDRNMFWRCDADTNMIPANVKQLDFDFVSDNHLLSDFPRDYKHNAPRTGTRDRRIWADRYNRLWLHVSPHVRSTPIRARATQVERHGQVVGIEPTLFLQLPQFSILTPAFEPPAERTRHM